MDQQRVGRSIILLAVAMACGPAMDGGPASAMGVAAGGDAGGARPAGAQQQQPSPAAEALGRAAAAYDAGDLAAAEAAAQECLQAAPDPDTADAALLLRARIAIREGRLDEARALLAGLAGSSAKYAPGYSALVDLLAADAAGSLASGSEADRRAAAERLDALALLPTDRPLTATRLELLLRLDLSLGRREPLVRHAAWYLSLAVPRAAAERWTSAAEAVLADDSALTDGEIVALFSEIARDSPLWPSLARRRAQTALAAGDLATATAVVDAAAASHPDAPWLTEVRGRIAATADVDSGRIGALLPLSGPSELIGRRALAAMEIALERFGTRFTVEVRDTGGDEAAVREAVRSLAEESHAVAIVGPAEARIAAPAAEAAAAAGVPIVSLNVQRDVAGAASCRFRNFPTYAAEAEALVAYAWDHARGRRVVVLRAEARYGELFAGHVADAVERRGGEVVAVEPYAADRTEFLDLAAAVRRAAPDVVVFADAAARVALVAPALAYEDVWPLAYPHDPASPAPGGPRREALYLLPSAAVDAAALGEARRYLEGAVVAAGFVPAARPEERTAFETAFAAQYPSGPTAVDAFAHDTVLVVATLVAAGATNRPALCRALDAVETVDSVAPFAGFGPDGEARRPIRLARVHDGALVAIE